MLSPLWAVCQRPAAAPNMDKATSPCLVFFGQPLHERAYVYVEDGGLQSARRCKCLFALPHRAK